MMPLISAIRTTSSPMTMVRLLDPDLESDDHGPAPRPGIRWGVARSAALVFLGIALAVGAALFLVRSSEPSAAAVSVHLEEDDGDHAKSTGAAAAGGVPEDPGGAAVAPDAASGPVDRLGGPGNSAAAADGSGAIVVYVTGAVESPGVATVTAGTRLFEVLEHVGGPRPDADLEGINLAGRPADGEHVHVLAVGEVPRPGIAAPEQPSAAGPAAGSAASPGSAPGSPAGGMDINTASPADIESLPRVGPVLAQRIIEWRDTNGPFARPADIDAVPGIGPALLEGILPLITTQ